MPLTDPPTYVSLPPSLIFHADDLERETYKALLQIVGWMWTTKWWQAGASAFHTTIAELAERWGIAERTVYYRLQVLHEKEWLLVTHKSGRVTISLGPRARYTPRTESAARDTQQDTQTDSSTTGREMRQHNNRPRDAADSAQQDTQTHSSTTGREMRQTDRPRDAANTTQDTDAEQSEKSSCKQLAREDAARASSLHGSINSSCSDPDSIEDSFPNGSEQLQTTNSARVLERLLDAGVFEEQATLLSRDPWVTLERVEGWIADIERQLRQKPGSIRSSGAVLYSNLYNHREPPPPPASRREDDPYRFVEGKYAAYIEH